MFCPAMVTGNRMARLGRSVPDRTTMERVHDRTTVDRGPDRTAAVIGCDHGRRIVDGTPRSYGTGRWHLVRGRSGPDSLVDSDRFPSQTIPENTLRQDGRYP